MKTIPEVRVLADGSELGSSYYILKLVKDEVIWCAHSVKTFPSTPQEWTV